MISCFWTWNRVPKTCSMFKNMNHVLEHEIMFWNMIWCSNHVQVIKHDLNIKSCSETWFHVPEHEMVFRKHALCLRTWIMFWNMKSCSETWFHVQTMVFGAEHGIMFQNMESCSETWFHVLKHDFMFRSCSAWTWFRHVRTCFEHAWTCFKHRACSGMFRALNMIWTWGALGRCWSAAGSHLVLYALSQSRISKVGCA